MMAWLRMEMIINNKCNTMMKRILLFLTAALLATSLTAQILPGEQPQVGDHSKRGADLRAVLKDDGDPPRACLLQGREKHQS